MKVITIKAYEGFEPVQQLNLFRNLYYNEGNSTERGIIANALNVILPMYESQRAELERLNSAIEHMSKEVDNVIYLVKELTEE